MKNGPRDLLAGPVAIHRSTVYRTGADCVRREDWDMLGMFLGTLAALLIDGTRAGAYGDESRRPSVPCGA